MPSASVAESNVSIVIAEKFLFTIEAISFASRNGSHFRLFSKLIYFSFIKSIRVFVSAHLLIPFVCSERLACDLYSLNANKTNKAVSLCN